MLSLVYIHIYNYSGIYILCNYKDTTKRLFKCLEIYIHKYIFRCLEIQHKPLLKYLKYTIQV